MTNSMILINGVIDNGNGGFYDTFKMIPILSGCPYNEATYNPTNKVLYVVSKEKKVTSMRSNNPIEVYYQYFFTTRDEIKKFIEMFSTNVDDFNYMKFMQN